MTYMSHPTERRQRRSDDPQVALAYQLETCCHQGGLDALILADEDGFCVAASGDPDACAEIAAQLGILGRKTEQFTGVLLGPDRRWDVDMRRFDIEGAGLYMCAVGGPPRSASDSLGRSIGGAARILA